MKDIGRTIEGNYIVEMNQNEHREFERLHSAVTGSNGFQDFAMNDYGHVPEFDFTNVFSIIRFYCAKRFMITELQSILDDMKSQLEKTK